MTTTVPQLRAIPSNLGQKAPGSSPVNTTHNLLSWTKQITKEYKDVAIVNMASSWQNGLAFACLIHHFEPNLIDFFSLNSQESETNLIKVKEALKSLGIQTSLDPKKFITVPSSSVVMVILTELHKKYGHISEKETAPSPLSLSRTKTEASLGSTLLSPRNFLIAPKLDKPKVTVIESRSKATPKEISALIATGVRRVWIPDEVFGWKECIVMGQEENSQLWCKSVTDYQECLVTESVVSTIKEDSIKPITNMILLSDMHEAVVLNILNQRYKKDEIYTFVGPMVISVNPFKELSIYSDEVMHQYIKNDEISNLSPHLYSISKTALQSLITKKTPQSIIITGESGSGKTEATKFLLKYVSVVTGGGNQIDGLSNRILATNPILEAFGNAKTVRNNNSSRFGKFIKIFVNSVGSYSGAKIQNFLLEKTRVVYQEPGERNYHSFYQLVVGADPEERKRYHLKNSPNEGDMGTPNDASEFKIVKEAFKSLGIPKDEYEKYFYNLSAILLLGNIKFEGEDQAIISADSIDLIEKIEEMLSLPKSKDILKAALTSRIFPVPGKKGETISIPLNRELAIENRDALAKILYTKMFDNLILSINNCLSPSSSENQETSWIAILDLYGFENFQKNSLEQFCINYANEKIHEQYNLHIFKLEQEEYIKEGVQWSNLEFTDNSATIELFEKPNFGLLSIMDEEVKMPKSNDSTLIAKFSQKHSKHSKFGNIKTN